MSQSVSGVRCQVPGVSGRKTEPDAENIAGIQDMLRSALEWGRQNRHLLPPELRARYDELYPVSTETATENFNENQEQPASL